MSQIICFFRVWHLDELGICVTFSLNPLFLREMLESGAALSKQFLSQELSENWRLIVYGIWLIIDEGLVWTFIYIQ